MDKIVSHEQLLGFIHEIRALRQGFVTNFYWDEKRHSYWVERGEFFFVQFVKCYLLVHKNPCFCNLFYIATDLEHAAESVKRITFEHDCVVDMIFKDGNLGEESFHKAGFEPYCHLYRMSHIGQLQSEEWYRDSCVQFADENCVPSIHVLLNENFDYLCEQLPSLQELSDFVKTNEVLVVKKSTTICAFLIFQLSGTTSWYLRYWYTRPGYRDIGLGSKLLKSALLLGKSTRRQQLWVKADNENAIKRYEHYGFRKEKLNDYVMIKRAYSNEKTNS